MEDGKNSSKPDLSLLVSLGDKSAFFRSRSRSDKRVESIIAGRSKEITRGFSAEALVFAHNERDTRRIILHEFVRRKINKLAVL